MERAASGRGAGDPQGYISDIDRLAEIPQAKRAALSEVSSKYVFRINSYYKNLIDWDDPHDPLRTLVVPHVQELEDWGRLDASDEESITVAPGVQHKYTDTALLLCNDACTAYCRYCFRKRLFMPGNDEASRNVDAGLRYIADHPEITNVLLTGGDPLVMSTRRIVSILDALRAITHVRIVRIGSKVPAFDPMRISEDAELLAAFRRHSTTRARLYLMAHFDHPRELSAAAVRAVASCVDSGVICANQCPIILGVNDCPEVLSELFGELAAIGCPPYYVFQCRPTAGNLPYAVSLVRSWQIFSEAMSRGPGLACRARFIVSHHSGKVEVMQIDATTIYCRYHQAKLGQDRGRFFSVSRDDDAYWLDLPARASEIGSGSSSE